MKKTNRFCTYFLLMSFVFLLVNSCKKDSSSKAEILTIGQSYQGGVIAYILRQGDNGYDVNVQHGLITSSSDQSEHAVDWGCRDGLWGGSAIPNAAGTAIGTGNQNTIDIMAGCTKAGIAARLCGDLVLGGYSDWYLPSKDELDRVNDNKAALSGFDKTEVYWSSSQYWTSGSSSNYGHDAWVQDFADGQQYGGDAKMGPHVLAIRSF